jgi:pimeloyl-ACP methyl ester carboxylesterase
LRRIAAGASVVAALSVAPAAAQTAKTVDHPATAHSITVHTATGHPAIGHPVTGRDDASHAHVYLMRGLLNIFSLGMDQLAAQIQRNGIDASVYNHSVEESVVTAIVQKYRGGDHGPYILVGHSLGADAVMVMAQQLNAQNVPVALVVPFDGTESYAAPANVSCVVNLTQRKYAYVQAGAGFHGKLSNVDVSSDTTIDHITIDKSPRLQALALKEILQAAHGQSCRPGQNAPAVVRAKEPKEIAPKEIAPKEIAPKEDASGNSAAKGANPATTAAPTKPAAPANSTPAAKTAAPAKSAAAAMSAAPVAPAKSAAPPRKSAAPEKSAAAAARSS